MAFNLEKLQKVAKPRSETAVKRAQERKENREWLRMSQDIALNLHYCLRNTGMSQKDFADKMGVSAVYVGKLLKGGENLTLETICKIQYALGEKIVSVAKPYINVRTVTLNPLPRFSETARSEKYRGNTITQNTFAVTSCDVA